LIVLKENAANCRRPVKAKPEQEALKEKAERQALKAQPKPTPTPLPHVDIFAPYRAPSLLDSIPTRPLN